VGKALGERAFDVGAYEERAGVRRGWGFAPLEEFGQFGLFARGVQVAGVGREAGRPADALPPA
jgi:hypothetical protein